MPVLQEISKMVKTIGNAGVLWTQCSFDENATHTFVHETLISKFQGECHYRRQQVFHAFLEGTGIATCDHHLPNCNSLTPLKTCTEIVLPWFDKNMGNKSTLRRNLPRLFQECTLLLHYAS